MVDAIRIMISGQADSAVVLSPLKNLFMAGDGIGVCRTRILHEERSAGKIKAFRKLAQPECC